MKTWNFLNREEPDTCRASIGYGIQRKSELIGYLNLTLSS